jgi:hypothetical protein
MQSGYLRHLSEKRGASFFLKVSLLVFLIGGGV